MKISKINFAELYDKENKRKKVEFRSKIQSDQDSFMKNEDASFSSLHDNVLASFVIKELHQEEVMNAYINVLTEKGFANTISKIYNKRIEEIFYKLVEINTVLPLLNASGIYNIGQMANFAKICHKNQHSKEVFANQKVQAVKIYGILENKKDLADFPDILLYLYSHEATKENPNFNKLNEYVNFLRCIGVNKSEDFDKNFAHLKPEFNDFEDVLSRIQAIDYLKQTYDKKISYFRDLLNQNGMNLGKDAEKFYQQHAECIDYFYQKNDGKNLDGLSEILNLVLNQKKLKTTALQTFGFNNNNFASIESRIRFFRLLSKNRVSVDEFNRISKKSFIEDNDKDILRQIANKNLISKLIKDIVGIDNKKASEFYNKFSDVINAVYDDEQGNADILILVYKLADNFKIRNSDGFLGLYNNFTRDKRRTLTKDELRNFLELFKYCYSFDIFEQAKKQKKILASVLLNEKNKFEAVEVDIENFLNSPKGAYFAGESALNIYKKYYNLFQNKKNSTFEILKNIARLNIENEVSYREKIGLIDDFVPYFGYEETIKFINENKISTERNPEDVQYRANCLEILESIDDKESSGQQVIDYLKDTGFLLKSRDRLDEFLSGVKDKEKRKEILSLIAKIQIPSFGALESFFKEYETSDDSNEKLLLFLKNLPENVDFVECTRLLNKLKSKIRSLEFPLEINADNINCVDIKELLSSSMVSDNTYIEFINRAYGVPKDSCFVGAMTNAKTNECNKFSSKNIAEEIVFKMKKSSESYQNIIRLLQLDKKSLGLDEEIPDYLYIRALIQVLPEEFVDFVNSNDWIKYSNDDVANLSLHARLRAIDRFALSETDDISDLYSDETKEKLKNVFETVYTKKPLYVKGSDYTQRIVVDYSYNSNIIKAIFAPKGELITLFKKQANWNKV